jgi:hypothetical protein
MVVFLWLDVLKLDWNDHNTYMTVNSPSRASKHHAFYGNHHATTWYQREQLAAAKVVI